MICLIALIVFGILAIFSVSYRPLAKEAFDCVFRRFTFRKCSSGLDSRLKSKIVGKVMNKNLFLGRHLYRYFEVLSWIFVILFFASLVFSADAIYNLAVYDNCNGPNADPEECVFDSRVVECSDPLCDEGNCEECGDDCGCMECTDG